MKKQLFYGLAAVAAVATPVIAVVSCGKKAADTQKTHDTGADKASVVIPHIPAFDDFSASTLTAYKATLVSQFDHLFQQDGTTALDFSTINNATTAAAAKAAATAIATAGVYTSATSQQHDAVLPHDPEADAHKAATISTYKQTLAALFANKYSARTPIDTTSITGADVAAIKAAATTLAGTAKTNTGAAATIAISSVTEPTGAATAEVPFAAADLTAAIPADPTVDVATWLTSVKTALKGITGMSAVAANATAIDGLTGSTVEDIKTAVAALHLVKTPADDTATPPVVEVPFAAADLTQVLPADPTVDVAAWLTSVKTALKGITGMSAVAANTTTIDGLTGTTVAAIRAAVAALHLVKTPAGTAAVTPEQLTTYKAALVAIFADKFSSVTLVSTSTIDAATTVQAAYDAALALNVDDQAAHGDNLPGLIASLTTKPAFDDFSATKVTEFKTNVKNAFAGLTTDGTAAVDVTVFDALTTIEAIKTKFAAINTGLRTPGTATQQTVTAHELPARDAYTQATIDAYKAAVVKAFTDKGVADSELATIKAATTVDAIEKAAIAVHPANGDSVSEAKASLEALYELA